MNILSSHKWFFTILFIGAVLRIVLNSAVDSFDFYAFVMWAKYLSTHRMSDVFEFLPEGYTPYPPLYYYVLKLLGLFITLLGVWDNKWLTYLIVRGPIIAADIAVAILVYQFTKKNLNKSAALAGAAFYFLHPVTIYNTSIWGQIDSVVTLLGLVSILAFTRKAIFWGIGAFTLGVVTKLQILALLPITLFLSFVAKNRKKTLTALLTWFSIASLPFFPIIFAKGVQWTWSYFFTIPNWYAYTSVYTYNLWAPFGFILSDNTKILGLVQYKYVGILLFWWVAYFILKPLFQERNRRPDVIMFAAFLLWYNFSFFSTRIHSRYLIYSFGFFAPFILRFPALGVLLSILMIANLLLPGVGDMFESVTTFLNTQQVIVIMVSYAFMVFLYAMHCYKKLVYFTKW